MRAGKIIHQHRHGKGRTSVHRLSPARPGPIGDAGVSRAADTFVDVFPVVSLAGVKPERMRDPRGDTMKSRDESHIQRRTRGRHGGGSLTPLAEK